MRIRCFGNFFGKIGYVFSSNINISKADIKDIIDIFDSKYLLLLVVAFDYSSESFKKLTEAHKTFEIIFPTNNNITAQTKIIGKTEDIKMILDELIDSDPRCITFCGFNGNIDSKKTLMQLGSKKFNENKLLLDNVANFIISLVIEENFMQLSFNKNSYDSKFIFKEVKSKLRQKR